MINSSFIEEHVNPRINKILILDPRDKCHFLFNTFQRQRLHFGIWSISMMVAPTLVAVYKDAMSHWRLIVLDRE